MYIKKGDTVSVLTGKDRGKSGKVLRAFPKLSKVVVEGINLTKKHQRATKANQKGQVVERPMPFHVSNVALLDSKTKKPTRVRFQIEKGKKTRISTRTGVVV